jgi:hypothetical protein
MRNRVTLSFTFAILILAGACKSETKDKKLTAANREFWVLSESRPFQYFHLDVEANKFDGGQELATEWGNADFLRETGSWRFESGEQGFTLHSGKGEALALTESDRAAYKGRYAHDAAAGYLKVSLSLSGAAVNERVWQYFSKEDSLYAISRRRGV